MFKLVVALDRMMQGLLALFFLVFSSGFVLASTFVPDGTKTSKPYGHVAYCKANPAECQTKRQSAPDVMNSNRLAKIHKINNLINQRIKPVSDQISAGVADHWSASVKSGDCEDYALAKRRKLISAGFKPTNLRLAMVRTSSGEAHLVLVIRTDQGDLVLDNLKSEIKPWNQTGYRFVKIQATGGSAEWVSVAR